MLNNILEHKIAAGVIMIVILAGAWYGLTGTSAPPPILKVQTTAAGSEEIVRTLLALQAVTLTGTIFSDPVFMSLQDFGVEIQDEPVGRPNPFLPIVQASLPTQQTLKSAQIFAPTPKK